MTQPPPPPAPPTHDWSTSYPMTPQAALLGRLHARRRLTSWQWQGDIDDAVLVVSELVTNAARHGKAPGHHLWLRLALAEDGGLIVDVSDPNPTFPGFGAAGAAQRETQSGGEGGRGLTVVRQLAHDVGWFLRTQRGKTVRARLPGAVG